MTWSPAFSRALDGLYIITLSSRGIFREFSLLLISHCDFLSCFYETQQNIALNKVNFKTESLLEQQQFSVVCSLNRKSLAETPELTKIHLFTPSKHLPTLTPMSDQERISPYNINTKASRQAIRVNTNVNQGTIS